MQWELHLKIFSDQPRKFNTKTYENQKKCSDIQNYLKLKRNSKQLTLIRHEHRNPSSSNERA